MARISVCLQTEEWNPGLDELNYKWLKERENIHKCDLMLSLYHPQDQAIVQ